MVVLKFEGTRDLCSLKRLERKKRRRIGECLHKTRTRIDIKRNMWEKQARSLQSARSAPLLDLRTDRGGRTKHNRQRKTKKQIDRER